MEKAKHRPGKIRAHQILEFDFAYMAIILAAMAAILATLCYIRHNSRTLMLYRNKKPDDIHEGKYNGLGGKFLPGETPEQCVIREVIEESGLTIKEPELRGIITFPVFDRVNDWYVFVFTADKFQGELIESAEGCLEWVNSDKLDELPLWDGDRIFLKWLDDDRFFSAQFIYEDGDFKGHTVKFYE
jgi:8-oxo-dGTP diphosphatase